MLKAVSMAVILVVPNTYPLLLPSKQAIEVNSTFSELSQNFVQSLMKFLQIGIFVQVLFSSSHISYAHFGHDIQKKNTAPHLSIQQQQHSNNESFLPFVRRVIQDSNQPVNGGNESASKERMECMSVCHGMNVCCMVIDVVFVKLIKLYSYRKNKQDS